MLLPKGVAANFYFPLVTAGSDDWKTTPTIAAGDIKISKDGGALANPATLPAESPAGSGLVKVALSGTEMNANCIAIKAHDAAGAEWKDTGQVVYTTGNYLLDALNEDVAQRIVLAAAAGKSALSANTRTYRDQADSKNRISATTDSSGQRTAVTVDGTP